jgi:hypothetical protein
MSLVTRAFPLKPVTLTKEQLIIVFMLYNHQQPEENRMDLVNDLIAVEVYGLIKIDTNRAPRFIITEAGRGLIGLLPSVVSIGRCKNCGTLQPIQGEEAIQKMFSEPDRLCTDCRQKLFEQTADASAF